MARGTMRIEMGALGSCGAGEGDSSARGGNLPMLPSLEGNAVVAQFHERAGSAEVLAPVPDDAGEHALTVLTVGRKVLCLARSDMAETNMGLLITSCTMLQLLRMVARIVQKQQW